MKFLEMHTFAAVVDAGSFVKASDRLEMSKAAVSRHVSNLEARLGVRLLHRTTRQMSLTGEGEIFYARCREVLDALDAAEAELTSRSGEAVGRIRINAPVTFGIRYLAEVWGAFRSMHPRVTLDVELSDRIVDLVEEGYDLAIRISRLPSSTLISRKLSSTRLVLCASPEYLARMGPPGHPSDLIDHDVLAYSYFEGSEEWPFEGPEGTVSARIRPGVSTNSGDTCRVGALNHHGIVLQPSFIVGPDLEEGALVELLPEYRSLELGIYALYPSRQHISPKLRLLIDYLVETFSTPQWPA